MNMNDFFEVIGTVVTSAVSIAWALLQGIFDIKDSVDTAKDQFIAAALGIPLILVSIAGIILTIVGIVRFISKIIDRFS